MGHCFVLSFRKLLQGRFAQRINSQLNLLGLIARLLHGLIVGTLFPMSTQKHFLQLSCLTCVATLWEQCFCDMATRRFTTEIKTRISPKQKRDLVRIAKAREVDVSDLVREAFRTLIESENSQNGGKAVPA